ncbi:tetratricopeptide repeat protein [Coleofasciculus sp. E2-BRE-01]|uniref:tetratricopeptide repeat protein n=1 Tax=Coleofasciculus sp. E2-BRE-01 TaxID=3069524 RepID=UPI0032F4DBDE
MLQSFWLNFPVTFRESEVVAQTSDARKAEADQRFQQGIEQSETSQFEAALQSWQQALIIYREIKDRQGEVRTLRNLGLVYRNLGDYPKAIEHFQQSLAIARQIQDRQGEIWILRFLGKAYQDLRDYAKAIEYFQQSLVIAREIENFQLETIVRYDLAEAQSESNPRIAEAVRLQNQGQQQYQTNQIEAALQSWQQALNIYQQTKERQGEGLILRDLGNAYDSLGDYARSIDRSIEYHQQYLAVARETEDRLSEGFALLYLKNAYANQGIQQFQNSQFEAAIQSWQQALSIDQEIKNGQDKGWTSENLGLVVTLSVSEGQVLGNLGFAYLNLGDYAKAIDYSQQSLTIARANGDSQIEGQVLGNLGVIYLNQGDYPKAIDYSQQSLTIARQIQDPQVEGRALLNLGAGYLNQGDYPKAIDYSQQSLAVAREIQDPPIEGQALGNLGMAHFYQGDYPKAIDYSQRHLKIAHEIQDRQGEGRALLNLGAAYLNLGSYSQVIEYSQQSLAIAREIQDSQIEGRALGGIGLAYLHIGDYPKAIEYFQQHLEIARQIQERKSESVAIGNIGAAYLGLRDFSKAIDYFQQQLTITRQIQDRQGEGTALGNLSISYRNQGDYLKAIDYSQQSLAIARQIQDHQGEGITLGGIGLAYLNLGDYPKAIDYFQQTLAIAREIKDSQSEGRTLNNLGLAFYGQGNLTSAESTLFEGIKVLESLRGGLDDNQKVSIFDTQLNTYLSLQRVLIARNKTNEALEISERGRTQAFVELLRRRLSPLSETPPPIKHFQLNDIKKVAQQQNTTLVEYSLVSPDALYIWVISPKGKVTFRQVDLKLPGTTTDSSPLQILVTETLESLGVGEDRNGIFEVTLTTSAPDPQRQTKSLTQLHQLLIQPIADLLPSNSEERVIFIPHQDLFRVPFPALMDSDGKYLVEKHTILTAPSIQALELTREQRQRIGTRSDAVPGNNALIVGNPSPMPSGFSLLKGAEKEAFAVAKLLNTEPLIGSQATEPAIMQKLPNARIIHLATHGTFNEQQPLLGGIALASTGNEPHNDGLLTAEEIFALNEAGKLTLNAELLILSACNTGRGRITGDGVIGLSRSFISAGVPSVLVSLWSVPDAPTAELMTEFYANFYEKNLDKAQSLRMAMLAMMEKHHDNPRAWAAFTLIGEAE